MGEITRALEIGWTRDARSASARLEKKQKQKHTTDRREPVGWLLSVSELHSGQPKKNHERDLNTGHPRRVAKLPLCNSSLKYASPRELHIEMQATLYRRHKVSGGLLVINTVCTVLGFCLYLLRLHMSGISFYRCIVQPSPSKNAV